MKPKIYVASEAWELIEGKRDRREMSRVVKSDDKEFIVAYVITEATNEAARAEDMTRGRVIATAPKLLAALQRLIYFHDTNDTPNGDPWKNARTVIAEAEASS